MVRMRSLGRWRALPLPVALSVLGVGCSGGESARRATPTDAGHGGASVGEGGAPQGGRGSGGRSSGGSGGIAGAPGSGGASSGGASSGGASSGGASSGGASSGGASSGGVDGGDAGQVGGSDGGLDASPDGDASQDAGSAGDAEAGSPLVCTPPGSAIVVLSGFRVDAFASVRSPAALAVAPTGSAFPAGVYVSSSGPAGVTDDIVRLDAQGSPTPFANLPAAADPAGLAFGLAGTPFQNRLIVSANNLGGPSLVNGAMMLVDPLGVASTLTAIGRPNGPQEPSGIALPTTAAFGAGMLVANSCADQGNILRVDSAGALTAFHDSNVAGCNTATEPGVADLAFGPGGAWGTDLYLADYNSCRCIRSVTSAGVLSSPFTQDLGDVPRSLVFGPGGPWNGALYVALGTRGSIQRVDSSGAASPFAAGFTGIGGGAGGALAFSLDGTTLYVTDHGANTVYAIRVDARCPGSDS